MKNNYNRLLSYKANCTAALPGKGHVDESQQELHSMTSHEVHTEGYFDVTFTSDMDQRCQDLIDIPMAKMSLFLNHKR